MDQKKIHMINNNETKNAIKPKIKLNKKPNL